jgi:hypothetical protein
MRIGNLGILAGTVALAAVAVGARPEQAADGLRNIEVKRFGVSVQAPLAWNLIVWGQDDRAFVLRLPQEDQSTKGYVSCELALAPEELEDFRKRFQTSDEAEQKQAKPQRKLTLNRIAPVDGKRFGQERAEQWGKRLDSLWEYSGGEKGTSYELQTRVICAEMLYTFTLRTDQAHFDAYRADFEELLASAKLAPPETGLRRMPQGFWMQRDFNFALRLPDDWRPSFGPNDKVLFFATGKTHEVFTDNLIVLASAPKPLELEKLHDTLPREITAVDPKAEVSSRIIKQGAEPALETVIHTKRGPLELTIIERRFRGPTRNYEVKFTCETAEFKRIEAGVRKSLDSFIEVAEAPHHDPI